MICPICHSRNVDFGYAGSINAGDGLICFARYECLHCGHSWEGEIDCPDDDQGDQGDQGDAPSWVGDIVVEHDETGLIDMTLPDQDDQPSMTSRKPRRRGSRQKPLPIFRDDD